MSGDMLTSCGLIILRGHVGGEIGRLAWPSQRRFNALAFTHLDLQPQFDIGERHSALIKLSISARQQLHGIAEAR